MKSVNSLKDDHQINLLDDIRQWCQMYEDRAKKEPAKFSAITQLLAGFKTFVEEYFTYFEGEIDGNRVLGISPSFLREQVLQVVLEEWMVLSRAVEQRELQRYQTKLFQAEQDIKQYLPKKGINEVVVYFGEADAIRYNLYSPIPLISIPRDQFGLPDRMAGPHEIGHHVFANLADNIGELEQKHRELEETAVATAREVAHEYNLDKQQENQLAELLYRAVEETFADVYGTVVAGVEFAGSIMRILQRRISSQGELFVDDGEHPLPYLRPLLRLFTLEHLGVFPEEQQKITATRQGWLEFAQSIAKVTIDDKQLVPFTIYLGPPVNGNPPTTTVELPLVAIEAAFERFILNCLLPLAQDIQPNGIPIMQKQETPFQKLKQHKQQQVTQGEDLHKLLLRPLSSLSGQTNTYHEMWGYHNSINGKEWKYHSAHSHSH